MKRNVIVLFMCTSLLTSCTAPSNNTTTQAVTNESATTATVIFSKEDQQKSEEGHEAAEGHNVDYDNQSEWSFVSGTFQSPIDIVTSHVEKMKENGKITLQYTSEVDSEEDNGHSIQINKEGTAQINGRNFTLQQFHVHSPSEHTVDGKNFPIEVHFVHQSQSGRTAVIGVMFEVGEKNESFELILDNIKKEDTNTEVANIDTYKLLPQNLSYYHYLGSLTTPPLTENVEWYVLKNTVAISQEQFDEFKTYYNDNNRDIQPLNDRKILEHNE